MHGPAVIGQALAKSALNAERKRRNFGRMWAYLWLTSVLALWTFTASTADACTRVGVEHLQHQLDSDAGERDQTPPAPPRVTFVEASRRLGTRCRNGECVSTSCGDTASLELRFEQPRQDSSEGQSERLGYRVEVVSGQVPASLTPWLDVALRAEAGNLTLIAAYDDIIELDAVLKLVAVDGAGNESVASESFVARYEGCTKEPFGDTCQLDCSWASSTDSDVAVADPLGCREGITCSLAEPGRRSLHLDSLLPLVGLLMLRLWRRRSRSTSAHS